MLSTQLPLLLPKLELFKNDFTGIGDQLFSLIVSYRYTSNKTQLTEFPESKSDMNLFHCVLALK